MLPLCDYCRGPIIGEPILGRPLRDNPPSAYCCYGCLSLGEPKRQGGREPSDWGRLLFDNFTIRIGVSLLIASQSMIFGLAVSLSPPDPTTLRIVQGTILLATLVVVALLGTPLARMAWSATRRGHIAIESLFVITLIGALIASLQSFITGNGPIYFEVVSVLLIVYSIGKQIGSRSRATAMANADRWDRQLDVAHRIDSMGRCDELPVSQILPGDLVEVRPGEIIPVDGVIQRGVGFVSEAAVSGEPFVVVRRAGDSVLAGAASQDATFIIQATSRGKTRGIDELIRIVETARERPISLQAQADRLGRVFLPLIVGVAIITFAVWTYRSDWQVGLFHSMSVLLVACPCALGLATPILVWTALNRLSENGVIVRAGDAVERLSQIDTVMFDKTGTLTEDQFRLLDIATIADGPERSRILGMLSQLEQQISHPIAKAFANLPVSRIGEIQSLRVEPGSGVVAVLRIRDANHTIRIGRSEWIDADPVRIQTIMNRLLTTDGHRIDCEIDGVIEAVAILRERLRDTVPDTLTQLDRMGLSVSVLTGDASGHADSLRLPNMQSGLLPDEKRQRIADRQAGGSHILMVGDGMNDASGIAVAHVGMALSTGTGLANDAADITLFHDDLRLIPWSIALARNTIRRVRSNLLLAAGYNVLGISLAAMGLLHPIIAALLMVVSSLVVVWSSTRLNVDPQECGCVGQPPTRFEREARVLPRTMIHGGAILLQCVIAYELFGLSIGTLILCGCVGLSITSIWHRWASIPHELDMAFGMLTLGNLGMLGGWWADHGFSPIPAGACEGCIEALRSGRYHLGMWLGMLVTSNLAMWLLLRHPAPKGCHSVGMYTGGNFGMIVGMLAGGSMFRDDALTSLIGMAVGMVVGMQIGTVLITKAIQRFSWISQPSEPARTA